MSKHRQPEEATTNKEEEILRDSEETLQLASLQEKNLLLTAEIENQRKAYLRETEQAVRYANRKILLRILPLVRNYKRALLLAEKSESKIVKNFVTGFEMILNDFKDSLKLEGVKEYSPSLGVEVWNSNFCEVVDEVENNQYEKGTIIEVVESGYFLHEKLLSPAKVVVSKKGEPV